MNSALLQLVSSGANSSSSHEESGNHKRRCTSPCMECSEDMRREHMLDPIEFQQRLLTNAGGDLTEISDLPQVIVIDILSRLPLESILASKVAYRWWNRLTRDPEFIKLQLSRTKPLLILQPLHKPPLYLCLVDAEAKQEEPRVIQLARPLREGFEVMCSHNGLLCMGTAEEKPDPLCLYNPINMEFMVLPNSSSKGLLTNIVVCLGSDSTGRYKIVRHCKAKNGKGESKFEILSLGQSSWRELCVPPNTWTACRAKFLKGVFYFAMATRIPNKWWKLWLVAIDASDEKDQVISISENPAIQNPYSELLDIGGKLFVMEHTKKKKHSWMLCGNKVGEFYLDYRGTVRFRKCREMPCHYEVICKLKEEKMLLQHHGSGNYEFVEFCLRTQEYSDHYFERLPVSVGFKAFDFKPSFVSPIASALLC